MKLNKLLFLTLTLMFIMSAASALNAQVPEDFAIVLRENPVYVSLEIYADIIDTAQPKQFFPVMQIVNDDNGLIWAQVKLDEKRTGYLTDTIMVRMARDELESILGGIELSEIDAWDQEIIDSIQYADIEVGYSKTQVMFAKGQPLATRKLGRLEELSYRRYKIILDGGQVKAITNIDRLPLDKSINIKLTTDDPEYNYTGGDWEEKPFGNIKFNKNNTGTGVARYRMRMPVDGQYQFLTQWLAEVGNSKAVVYRIYLGGKAIKEFRTNQCLHNLKWTHLGKVSLEADKALMVEVLSEDGSPFYTGDLRIEYLNESLPIIE